MTNKARAALQRTMVQCERKAVMLDRFLDELRAARPSARITIQLERNRKAAAALRAKLRTTREELAGHNTPPVRHPADAPAGK